MHPKLCMHEHFDLIINPFKYKCEALSCYVFSYILVSAICNIGIMVLISLEWMIQFI